MLCRSCCARCAVPAASASSTVATLHSLYRRLLKAGEDGPAMRHHLTAHSLEDSIRYGMLLLQNHKALTEINAQQKLLPPYRFIRQFKLAVRKRYHAFQIFRIRLTLRSWTAISDLLVYCLFLTVVVLLYAIYRACRVGVNRAEERYRVMAIPIIQTFEALEEAQNRRRELRKEMEEDLIRSR